MNSFLFIIAVALYTSQISVEDLVSDMTLEEKAGQMVEAERADILPGDIENYTLGSILSGGGSVPTDAGGSFKNRNNPEGWVELLNGYLDETSRTRLQIPIIYGMDSVHGANNVIGATIFPHNINYGATFVGDELKGITNVQEEGKAVQEEVRALGLSWTYGPFLGNPQNIHWGRTYEGFSSNITIPTILGPEFIKALQKGNKVAACMKHYIGEGYTTDGINRGYANLTEDEVRALLPPYKAAVDAGALTLMPSFSRINGIVCSENEFILTTLLKEELGFKGFVVSDWDAVRNVSGATHKDQVANTINAGMDMIMATTDIEHTAAESRQRWIDTRQAIIDGVNDGTINQSRVDDAVERILWVKQQLGLIDNSITLIPGEVGTQAHRNIARRHVSDSLVLLKNKEDIIGRLSSFQNILVAGQGAEDIGMQCGGWTLTWQGDHGPIVPGTTLLNGFRTVASGKNFVYSENATSTLTNFDAVIVVVGEDPYAEWFGDIRPDQSDPNAKQTGTLRESDLKALQNAYTLGVPVIVIVISGRPLYLGDEVENWDALIAAFLPGSEAGLGIADVLFGNKNFIAKLSYEWPKSKIDNITLAYPFGAGLSKTPINNGDTTNSSDEKKKEVSPGIIVALLIIVAVVALLALIILIVVCVGLCRKGGYQSIIN